MNEEITMRTFDPDEVEPEDAIRMAREKERKAAQEQEAKIREESKEQGEACDPLDALFAMLMEAQEEEDRKAEREKKDNLVSACLFGCAAGSVVACMIYGLVDPVFAVPLAVVYCMRSAVRYDRWARM